MKFYNYIILFILLFVYTSGNAQEFDTFKSAKRYLASQVNSQTKTLYCGCSIEKQGKKLIPVTTACGYQARKPLTAKGDVNQRALRIEWEHIVPAWEFGHQLQCWQHGGRKQCVKESELFRKMEADINNLAPAIGEINGDRSNFRFGMLPSSAKLYGACDVKIDFKQRVVEPPPEARKRIAEAYLYMQKTYGLKISPKQQKLFNVWAGEALPENVL